MWTWNFLNKDWESMIVDVFSNVNFIDYSFERLQTEVEEWEDNRVLLWMFKERYIDNRLESYYYQIWIDDEFTLEEFKKDCYNNLWKNTWCEDIVQEQFKFWEELYNKIVELVSKDDSIIDKIQKTFSYDKNKEEFKELLWDWWEEWNQPWYSILKEIMYEDYRDTFMDDFFQYHLHEATHNKNWKDWNQFESISEYEWRRWQEVKYIYESEYLKVWFHEDDKSDIHVCFTPNTYENENWETKCKNIAIASKQADIIANNLLESFPNWISFRAWAWTSSKFKPEDGKIKFNFNH